MDRPKYERMNSADLRRAVADAVPPRPKLPFDGFDRYSVWSLLFTHITLIVNKYICRHRRITYTSVCPQPTTDAAPPAHGVDSGAETDSPPLASSGANSPAVWAARYSRQTYGDGLICTTPFAYAYASAQPARPLSRADPTAAAAPAAASCGSREVAIPEGGAVAGCEWRPLSASAHSANTVNAIRRIVDAMSVPRNADKEPVKLQLGDPTLTGTLAPHPAIKEAMHASVASGLHDGYGPAVGSAEARAAVARYATRPEAPVSADDVILTSGCSHALQLAIEAIADPGHNILVPCPGFPLYTTLMRPNGIQDRHYNLLAERGWEVDLAQLETLVDERTRAIVVNNPSNPCGAVYNRRHLEALLDFAQRHRLVVIADEIYGDMVYDGAEFHPMATLTPRVPILCCDGISKRYLVPGWRLGWLIVHDPLGALKHVRDGLRNLAQKIVGPCAIVQGALPAMLSNTPADFFDSTRRVLQRASHAALDELSRAPGLTPVRPYGAMYLFVNVDMDAFPEFRGNELELIKALIAEESVYCLPGSAFHHRHSFRVVLTYEERVTRAACARIRQFCERHHLPKPHRKPSAHNDDAAAVAAENDRGNVAPLAINHLR